MEGQVIGMDVFGMKRRQEAKEIERRVRFKRNKSKVDSYVRKLREKESLFVVLGKKAHGLNDEVQFDQIAKNILWIQTQRHHWERFSLMLETMEARRDQVAATGAFVESMQAMTESILKGVDTGDLSKMQLQMERAMARAETVEEQIAVVMEVSADSAFGSMNSDEERLSELKVILGDGSTQDESEAFDGRIENGLKAIEEELKKD